MKNLKRKILPILSASFLSILLLGLVHTHQQKKFIQKANTLFDPVEKAFTGSYLPWPIGRPSLFGGFDPKTANRIRASLKYESGIVHTNGMTLIIHASDGTYFVHADK